MTRPNQKVLQYLEEAHASEIGLVRVLQSQIAMTPRGSYRDGIERHLRETRDHAERIEARMNELGRGGNPLLAGIGVAETLIAQALALGKTPIDVLRGTSGEEKVLKNAKDACATEALEIATYTAIERLATSVGDTGTARLAASIRADEERMLERVLAEIPKLTEAVVRAEVEGDHSYDISATGAGEAAQAAGDGIRSATAGGGAKAKRAARQARSVPGAARVAGAAKGAAATAEDLPIPGYDALTAGEVVAQLPALSQVDLGKVEAYERKGQNRSTVLGRIDALRTSEPWPGYDDLSAAEIRSALADADDSRAAATRSYERAHRNRAGVLRAAERVPAGA